MSVYLTHNGETHNIGPWAKKLGIKSVTLQCRLARGWSVTRTLTAPVRKHSTQSQALESVVNSFIRQHQAITQSFLTSLQGFAHSSATLNAAMVASTDMQTIGQPPEGTFKAPIPGDGL